MQKIVLCVKGIIPPRDRGTEVLTKEYRTYKGDLIPKVQEAVRAVVKDRSIKVYAQQKWMIDQKLTRYLRLPFHPMPFQNQSVWIEKTEKGRFYIHLKTKQEEGEV